MVQHVTQRRDREMTNLLSRCLPVPCLNAMTIMNLRDLL
jgi:hypothetical protein